VELFSSSRRPTHPEKSVNDDVHLVEAALAGDASAYGDLVERYQQRLFNTVLWVVGSREDATDLVQDAFVQAYAKLQTFRGAAQFYTWLYRIAMNLALSHRRKRRPTVSVDDFKQRLGEEPADPSDGPQRQLDLQEEVQQVQVALARLGSEHRQILVLREIEGCSYESISEILELPVGTVRSRLFRARMQLKEKLQSLRVEELRQDAS
jgi:RNA polymerase sigma-70 factor (ECF subfamily)